MKEINLDRLKDVLFYEEETGLFRRLKDSGSRTKAGDIAGGLDRNGHVRIYVDGQIYAAHRLAWLYMYGSMPCGVIDHMDGNRSNNAISNLRDVSMSVNQQNQRKPHSRGTTGFLGVTFNKRRGKFMAQIGTKTKHIYLGLYETAEEASEAYLKAKRSIHEGCLI